MAELKLTREILEAAVLGASVLGGGDADSLEAALELGELALRMGEPVLVDVDDVNPEGTVITASSVSCPRVEDPYLSGRSYIRSMELLLENGVERPVGLISNECNEAGVVHGWLEGAVLGIPVVDAPCNGRAHPTSEMGSMGLHLVEGYVSVSAFCGGNPDHKRSIEGVFRGSVETASSMVRHAACTAGGILAVARNPVKASYLRENGAPGAIKQAIRLGNAMKEAAPEGGEAVIQAAADALSGSVIYRGRIDGVDRFTAGGMISGKAVSREWELTFWKDYMTVDEGERRVATFPDLITVFDEETGKVISSENIAPGMNVAILAVPRSNLLLGCGMRSPALFEPAEKIVGKSIVQYLDL